LKTGETKFKTYNLICKDEDTLKFKPVESVYSQVWLNWEFGLVLVALSFIFVYYFVIEDNNIRRYTFVHFITLGLPGLMIILSGYYLLYKSSIPIVFNKRVGLYWKGRQTFINRLFPVKWAYSVNFKDIKGVQLLPEYFYETYNPNGDRTPGYYSYEINLVLTNNERLNVVDHGNKKSALKDAAYLAEFMDVPFFNGLDRIA